MIAKPQPRIGDEVDVDLPLFCQVNTPQGRCNVCLCPRGMHQFVIPADFAKIVPLELPDDEPQTIRIAITGLAGPSRDNLTHFEGRVVECWDDKATGLVVLFPIGGGE